MKKLIYILAFLAFGEVYAQTAQWETITINDSNIPVTADIYKGNKASPYLLLFHQASFSRGEYRETAPQLMEFGYSAIAIDQRSGKAVNEVENETAIYAIKHQLTTNYIDAYEDMVAALKFTYNITKNPVVIVGSSYSASLVFKLAKEYPTLVKAIIAFSPGEYYRGISVASWVAGTAVPTLVTSSKSEAKGLTTLIKSTPSIKQFIPLGEGKHGSKALWKTNENKSEYWVAVRHFLGTLK